MDKRSNPVGIGIIGCGMISTAYAKAIVTHHENLKIVAAYDTVLERTKEFVNKFGGQAFSSIKELLDVPEVELVVNLTIHTAHAEITRQALRAGKHVYSEKPLATSREDGNELVRMAKEKNLLLGCAPFAILGEAQQTLWKAVRDGMVGEVLEVTADMMDGRPEKKYLLNPIPFYSPGAGPMLDVGCYSLNVLTSIFGPIRAVMGMANIRIPERIIGTGPEKGKKFTVTTPDHITGLIEFANGIGGRISASFVVEKSIHTGIEIYGTLGTLRLDPCLWHFNTKVLFCSIGKGEWKKVPFISEPQSKFDWARGLLDMVESIHKNRPCRCDGQQANHILDVCFGILESAKNGCKVKMESSFESPNPVYT